MEGPLRTGAGAAAGFVAQVADVLRAELGFDPVHGTLNVEASPPEPSRRLDGIGDEHCDGVDLTPCSVFGVRAAVIRPLVPGYPDRKVELVAPVHLRTVFGLDPGDRVEVTVERPWPTTTPSVDPSSLGAFAAVVLDATDTVPDGLEALDCPVAALGPADGGPAPNSAVDIADAVIDGAATEGVLDFFDRFDVTPGNSVLLTDAEAGAELAHEAGTSVLRYRWL